MSFKSNPGRTFSNALIILSVFFLGLTPIDKRYKPLIWYFLLTLSISNLLGSRNAGLGASEITTTLSPIPNSARSSFVVLEGTITISASRITHLKRLRRAETIFGWVSLGNFMGNKS